MCHQFKDLHQKFPKSFPLYPGVQLNLITRKFHEVIYIYIYVICRPIVFMYTWMGLNIRTKRAKYITDMGCAKKKPLKDVFNCFPENGIHLCDLLGRTVNM